MNGNDSNQGLGSDDSLIRVKEHFGVKGKPPIIQPKPKPGGSGKKLQIQATGGSSSSPIRLPPSKFQTTVNGKKSFHSDGDSDEGEDPGDIVLNPNSLAQFAQIDLDAVKRYQMLDSTAQRQKAYLSHGKGLQSRRLPSHLAHKVGDDYYEKRKSYDPKVLLDSPSHHDDKRNRSKTDATALDDPIPPQVNVSSEDREKEIMNKVGVPQGTALAGLASIFRKGSTKKLTRSASSSSRDFTPPQVKAKPSKKKHSDNSSPDLSRLRADPNSSPSMRSSFKLFKKKKGRLSRGSSTDDVTKGSVEDLRSETSSLSSISRISIREEDAFEGNFPPVQSPHKEVSSPLKEASSVSHGKNQQHVGNTSPKPTTTSTPLATPFKPDSADQSSSSSSNMLASPTRKDRADSSLFKDASDLFGDKENLFDSAELSSLLAKTKTEFGKKEDEDAGKKPLPATHKAENSPLAKKVEKPKPVTSSMLDEPAQKGPSKPMRKNRSRVLDTSLYDKAAETAIKNTKDRKSEREKEKELEKKREEERRKPQIALFEELDEEDDLFGEKKDTKKEADEKKVITKDDLFSDLDEPVKPVKSVEEEMPKPKLLSDELFSSDSKPDEQEKPVVAPPEAKPSLFDELEEHEPTKDKEDIIKSLFGDDSEKFTSKLTGPPTKSTDTTKMTTETHLIAEKSKLEIESEERKTKQEKVVSASASNVFEDPLDTKKEDTKPSKSNVFKDPLDTKKEDTKPSKSNVFKDPLDAKKEDMKPKPPTSKKPSLTSPGPSPTKTKPPPISNKPKPKRVSKPVCDNDEVKKPSWKKELEERQKGKTQVKGIEKDSKAIEKESKDEEDKKEAKKLEEKRKIEEEELQKKDREEKEKKMKEEEEKKKLEKEKKQIEEKEKIEAEKEKKKLEEERLLNEEAERMKAEEEKERKKAEEEKEKKKAEEEKERLKAEEEKVKAEEEKVKAEKEKVKAEKEMPAEQKKEDGKKDEQSDTENKKTTQDKTDVKEKEAKTEVNEKPIPEWKRKANEKKLQREKEEKENMASLEERRKKREELKASRDKNAASPKPSKKPPIAKAKPKPLTSGVSVTLSTTSTNQVDNNEKEKSPVSPPAKEQSPTIDPSLPKWKQDLIAKRKSSGPTSPRRSTVSVAIEKKEDDLPAWKRELLAKKKATGGEGSGIGSKSSTASSSTSSPKPSRHTPRNQPVPEFMKEFQNKKKA